MKAARYALVFCATFLLVTAPFLASAQIPVIVPCDGVGPKACTVCHLATLAQNILNAVIFIAVFASAFLFAYAGWLYLTNEAIGGQQKAKSLFTDVTIGFVIILGSWLFVDTLMKVLVGESISGFGPWNSICGGK
jgi:hypothetical protein